jgi:osmotically-inducible protein OsmY
MKNDHELQQAIVSELERMPHYAASRVDVTVHRGVAALRGYVKNFSDKVAAVETAKLVSGVRSVSDDIEVDPSGQASIHDTAYDLGGGSDGGASE